MAQFNSDVDSGIIRISQLIYGICPGMSQATLFSSNSSFVVPSVPYTYEFKRGDNGLGTRIFQETEFMFSSV